MTDYDRIITSVPLNSTTGRVVSKGEHYEPTIQLANHVHDKNFLAYKAPPEDAIGSGGVDGLVGYKFGTLTVMGLSIEHHTKGQPAKWVVRCICGNFEIRRARAIRNPENVNDRCQECHHVRRIKERYQKHGSKSFEEFVEKK